MIASSLAVPKLARPEWRSGESDDGRGEGGAEGVVLSVDGDGAQDPQPMTGLAVWVPAAYGGDRLFSLDPTLDRDGCLSPYRALRDACLSIGVEAHTQDVWLASGRRPTAVLLVDLPKTIERTLAAWGDVRRYLLLQECAVVVPRQWMRGAHDGFERVFTWHSDLLRDPRYVRVHFSQDILCPEVDGWANRDGWACLIAGNKRSRHRDELYSARIRAIRWFERHQPGRFALFGIGWDRPVLPGPALASRLAARIPGVRGLLTARFPSYQGRIERKLPTLRRHRFCICFENAQRIPGYITEKMIDCLMAGCVPLYWGAPDIADHVDERCYLDYRSFSGMDEAYERMAAMTEDEYRERQTAMRDYLASGRSARFSSRFFAHQIVATIFGGHGPA